MSTPLEDLDQIRLELEDRVQQMNDFRENFVEMQKKLQALHERLYPESLKRIEETIKRLEGFREGLWAIDRAMGREGRLEE